MKTRIFHGDDKARYFRKAISAWGRQNTRVFPWRKTKRPYQILLAEMMLRRTNANQVTNVFLVTLRLYPNARSLATASRKEVYKILQPLGLAWRSENIRQMAKALTTRFQGRVPATYEGLRELPGVGDYVASAVCSFAYDIPMPLVDTNTVRVAGRYFGFSTHAESRRNRLVQEAVLALTSRKNSRAFNYSFLDFASIVCNAREPDCLACPVKSQCTFGQKRIKALSSRRPLK